MKNTQRQIEGMKKQTIGVEIEMADITRQKAIKVVANYFGTGNTVRHDGGSYDAWSCLDNQNRRWTITRDVSTVSYTHLDVYKRQGVSCAKIAFQTWY